MCVFSAIAAGADLLATWRSASLPDELTLGGIAIGLGVCVLRRGAGHYGAGAIVWLFGGGEMPQRWQSLAESACGAALPAFFLWGGGWLYERCGTAKGWDSATSN